VIQWDEALSSVRNVLEGWLEVQARWGHLAPLFGPSGLSSQLPLEVSTKNMMTGGCTPEATNDQHLIVTYNTCYQVVATLLLSAACTFTLQLAWLLVMSGSTTSTEAFAIVTLHDFHHVCTAACRPGGSPR
jgi:hypothetical protein